VDHIVGAGVELFREVCRQDLEGIVAKRRDGVYDPEAPTWAKIKNRAYSQAVGRRERFERMRAAVHGRLRCTGAKWPRAANFP
jgi:ATP-dependent DNA ligase